MKTDTRIIHSGRHPEENHGVVNPPVYHASTILFPTVEKLESRNTNGEKSIHYGLYGTPTTFALEDALAELEGGYDTKLFPSGLAAITIPMMAYLKAGDHLLMVDSVYGPTRRFCDTWLRQFGVETTYYDPMLGSDIKNFFRKNTKLVFLESPGSITFEVQDVPAICAEAKARGITTMIDNTWGTPIYFKPFEHGVDVSLHAGTKYINGHSDVMLGTATATREAFPALNQAANEFGQTTAPDDCYLALRGLRTLSVRLARHEKSALELAHWLQGREEVERVLHPALPSCPGHEFWKRDFLGSCGLFGVILKPATKKALAAMLDHMELFKMGYSWGGFESLILPHNPADIRTATKWQTKGPLLRLHAGLEDAQDLIRDLEKGFERLNQANG